MSILKKLAATVSTAGSDSPVNLSNFNKLIIGITNVKQAEALLGGKCHSTRKDGKATVMTWHNSKEAHKVSFSIDCTFQNNLLTLKDHKSRIAGR